MTREEAIDVLKANYPDPCFSDLREAVDVAIKALKTDVPDINVGDINKFIDGLEEIFADIRGRHGDDSVCGLCEYDGAYIGQSGDWCNECPGFDRDDCFKLSDKCRKRWIDTITNSLPSAQPEWNNHTVACLLAEMFGDDCACNFNGIDEWLPEKCEVLDSCPNPVGVACWEQFLKHRAERRTDDLE